MGVATGCGCKGVIDFLILLIPTPLVSALFGCSILTFLFILFYFICFSFFIHFSQIARRICTLVLFIIPQRACAQRGLL